MCVGLEHGGSGADRFPSLAACVAWSAHLIQAALCRWQIRCAGQGSLASGLSRAIDIEDYPLVSLPVPQPSRFFFLL